MVKASVIIPALNEEKLIENVLSQFTGEDIKNYNLEIIVSDGGSTDKTLEKARKYACNVIEHKTKVRQNISQGRNNGASISRGDVLIFFNADTRISDKKMFFEKIFEILENKSMAAIAFPIYVFPEEEKLFDKAFHSFYNNYVIFLNKFFMGMGRGECHVVRRDLFEKIGGYNEKLFAGEDFDLYKRLRKHGKIHFMKDVAVYESPRRYRRFGYFKVVYDWWKNSIWVTLFHKSSSDEWEAVR
ncbi:MAG: glycosyltransferase [Bacteroidetes bacterium]|nr:glycosyltransferase [Bacteroidota bacterium]MBX7046706.1 glycosyltransferase [Ignavibacteria bacterium]